MQFITNGPDIPDALLQAHEEDRVVFFCGAGISCPAGLPGFRGLVDEIYRRNGTAQSDIEREAFEREQYDATLDLLERRLPGQCFAVRRTLAESLTPKLRRKGATAAYAPDSIPRRVRPAQQVALGGDADTSGHGRAAATGAIC